MNLEHDTIQLSTADLHDAFKEKVSVCTLQFRTFGRRRSFFGKAETVRTYENHLPVVECVSERGDGRVLVIDGGGSLRVGLLGDRLAEIARGNGWAGIVVNGAIRDSVAVDGLDIGVKALGTTARRSWQPAITERGIGLAFGDIAIKPGHWVYADSDSVLVSADPLEVAAAGNPVMEAASYR